MGLGFGWGFWLSMDQSYFSSMKMQQLYESLFWGQGARAVQSTALVENRKFLWKQQFPFFKISHKKTIRGIQLCDETSSRTYRYLVVFKLPLHHLLIQWCCIFLRIGEDKCLTWATVSWGYECTDCLLKLSRSLCDLPSVMEFLCNLTDTAVAHRSNWSTNIWISGKPTTSNVMELALLLLQWVFPGASCR